MLFNSLQYYIFLPVAVVLYYVLPRRFRNPALLLLSYYFYMCWQPLYALLMLLSTVITYSSCLLMERRLFGRRRLWLILSLVLNLAILFFFKYFNFAAGLITDILTAAGLRIEPPRLDVLLPVGISFYTFQALGYTFDVYRGDVAVEKNFGTYALFVSFFPQLVAGPIERSTNLLSQFKTEHKFRFANLKEGMLPILWGLFKKIVVADQLAVLANTAYGAPEAFNGTQLIVATLAFAFQIYCDFSAYSDIARGSARLLGFELMQNFNRPYFATSIRDFWRRWHISLSSWFKDYLYFPLGGSRCSRARKRLNVLIVFTVSGLWHGASLTFVIWGLLNGLYQVVSEILKPVRDRIRGWFRISEDNRGLRVFRVLITFSLTCFAWILFRADTFADAGTVIQTIAAAPFAGGLFPMDLTALGLSRPELVAAALSVLLLLAVDFAGLFRDVAARINRSVVLRYAAYFALIAIIIIFGSYGAGYDPQDFVYFQF